MGADAMQLFAQSPRMWRFPEHAEEDLARFRERRAELGLDTVLVHALYLVNLAAPDDEIYRKSIETMRSTMRSACAIEADGVVVHVGSHLGSGFDAGLERAVPALRLVLEECSDTTWLLLENSAGAGGTIGRSLDEIAALVDALDEHPRLGVCLDSCHLYASGIDVTDRGGARPRHRRGRPAHRAGAPACAARERLGGAMRIESRPPRERARGRDGRGSWRLSLASVLAGSARSDGSARPRQPRAGRRRGAQGARAARSLVD